MTDYILNRDNNMVTLEYNATDYFPFVDDELNNFPNLNAKTEYQSKYIAYVVYDCEPFCLEDFNRRITIASDEKNLINLNFLYWRLDRLLRQAHELEAIYKGKSSDVST